METLNFWQVNSKLMWTYNTQEEPILKTNGEMISTISYQKHCKTMVINGLDKS